MKTLQIIVLFLSIAIGFGATSQANDAPFVLNRYDAASQELFLRNIYTGRDISLHLTIPPGVSVKPVDNNHLELTDLSGRGFNDQSVACDDALSGPLVDALFGNQHGRDKFHQTVVLDLGFYLTEVTGAPQTFRGSFGYALGGMNHSGGGYGSTLQSFVNNIMGSLYHGDAPAPGSVTRNGLTRFKSSTGPSSLFVDLNSRRHYAENSPVKLNQGPKWSGGISAITVLSMDRDRPVLEVQTFELEADGELARWLVEMDVGSHTYRASRRRR